MQDKSEVFAEWSDDSGTFAGESGGTVSARVGPSGKFPGYSIHLGKSWSDVGVILSWSLCSGSEAGLLRSCSSKEFEEEGVPSWILLSSPRQHNWALDKTFKFLPLEVPGEEKRT